MGGAIQRLLSGPRRLRIAMSMAIDAVLVAAAVWLAFVLRFEAHSLAYLYQIPLIFPVAMLATIVSFRHFGLYRSPLRYASGAMVYRIASAGTVAAVVVAAAVFIMRDGVVPMGALVILWGLLIALPGTVRFLIRDIVRHYSFARQRVPVAIYGAGSAGHQLATALLHGSKYQPVAFVDDAPGKRDQTISGLEVHTRAQLATLIEKKGVREVLVAIPAASRAPTRSYQASFQISCGRSRSAFVRGYRWWAQAGG